MTSSLRMRTRRQDGVGLVTAIFLLVVLAGLAVAMVSLYTTQQASSNLDMQGARAYQAARAGMEWGLFQWRRNGSCVASTALAMPSGTTLSAFTVSVRCSQSGGSGQPGDTLARTTIAASACNITDSAGGCNCDGASGACTPSANPETVNRRMEAQL